MALGCIVFIRPGRQLVFRKIRNLPFAGKCQFTHIIPVLPTQPAINPLGDICFGGIPIFVVGITIPILPYVFALYTTVKSILFGLFRPALPPAGSSLPGIYINYCPIPILNNGIIILLTSIMINCIYSFRGNRRPGSLFGHGTFRSIPQKEKFAYLLIQIYCFFFQGLDRSRETDFLQMGAVREGFAANHFYAIGNRELLIRKACSIIN